MIRVRVIGACGYGGAGAIELLSAHPEAELVSLVDLENVGRPISEVFPHLDGFCDLAVASADDVSWADGVDVAFTATPDGVGARVAPAALEAGVKLVDYSGDYRFNSAGAYAEYGRRIGKTAEHTTPALLPQAVYGLAELHRDAIRQTSLVGNPGCFAVSAILGLAPAVEAGLVDVGTLICDAKTGVSGAGIKPSAAFHYPSRYENMNAYKIAAHQHNCEIEHELSQIAGRDVRITLTTQVVPLARGIMTCCYGQLTDGRTTADDLLAAYEEFYAASPFVRVRPAGVPTSNNDVRGSNFCVLSVNVDARTGRMIVVSHIDNLMKGQAASAVQNMNLMFGLDETTGLMRPAFYP